MKFPYWLNVYGDTSYRGDCPQEDQEHVTFVNGMRKAYPALAAVMVHVQNEGKRSNTQAAWDKARGLNKGAADFIFAGSPALVIEMKRRDHTKSRWQDGQVEFLEAAHKQGAMVCVALGWEAAFEAVKEWQKHLSR